MKFDVLTLFPMMFSGPFNESVIGRAQKKGLISINLVDIRDYASGKHRVTDDYPYGGGSGMVMKPEPVWESAEAILGASQDNPWIILMSPQGELFCQKKAEELSRKDHLVLICGHYEGVDERIRFLVNEEISIGDYVLTGGEIPAMVVIDAVSRLIPGVLGGQESTLRESFMVDNLLEGPQYTRPRVYRGYEVPEVLISGNHEQIRKWRRKESLRRTLERRPDLLAKAGLTEEDVLLLEEIRKEATRWI